MDAVNKILSREIPATTAIIDETETAASTDTKKTDAEPCKKNRTHCG